MLRAMLKKLLNFDIAQHFLAMLTMSSTFESNFIRAHGKKFFGWLPIKIELLKRMV